MRSPESLLHDQENAGEDVQDCVLVGPRGRGRTGEEGTDPLANEVDAVLDEAKFQGFGFRHGPDLLSGARQSNDLLVLVLALFACAGRVGRVCEERSGARGEGRDAVLPVARERSPPFSIVYPTNPTRKRREAPGIHDGKRWADRDPRQDRRFRPLSDAARNLLRTGVGGVLPAGRAEWDGVPARQFSFSPLVMSV